MPVAPSSTGIVDPLREALEEIVGLTTYLRQGDPDPMDLQGLSDALDHATGLAHAALAVPESVRGAAQAQTATPQEVQEACAQVACRVAERSNLDRLEVLHDMALSPTGKERVLDNLDTRKRVAVEIAHSIRALIPPAQPVQGGDKGEAVAWCQPMDCGNHTPRKFLLYFDDPDHGNMVFDDEAKARDAFTRKNTAWNCYLFGSLPLAAPQPASNAGGEPWNADGFWQFVGGLAGEHEADQMRDMLGQHGLRIVGARDPAYGAKQPVTDAMCTVAIEAFQRDRIQGFSYKERGEHVIRDVWLPHEKQEIWTAPIAGPEEYQAFQRQCGIERMRKVLEAASSVPSTDREGGK